MAKDKEEILPNIDAMAIAAQLGVTNTKATETLQQLLSIQLEEAQERRRIADERRRREEAVRKQGALAAKREVQIRQARQAVCLHRKPDNSKYTGGIRSWDGVLHVTCGHCGKIWHGTREELMKEMGAGLFPNDEAIGGPILN